MAQSNDYPQHILWIDSIKVIGCILVVLGHFFQSMVKSSIVPQNDLYLWFNQTIYFFHVALFFIASGYLYQKNSAKKDTHSHFHFCMRKMIDLGIPYFVFSFLTYMIKFILGNATNDGIPNNFFSALINEPISPYWFLYSLFMCYLLFYPIKHKQTVIFYFVIEFIFLLLILNRIQIPFFAINTLVSNSLWFFIGMIIAYYSFDKQFSNKLGYLTLLFLPLSWIIYYFDYIPITVSLFMTVLGIMLSIWISSYLGKYIGNFIKIFSNYFLPIYLMHTIFAAGIRIILLKIGILNVFIHFILGIIFSFFLPVCVAKICDKIPYLNLFMYPTKTWNRIKKC